MREKIHGQVSSLSQSVISQLGGVAVELSVEELGSLYLTDRRSIAAMGTVSAWSNRQVSTRLSNVKCGQRQKCNSTYVSYLIKGISGRQAGS